MKTDLPQSFRRFETVHFHQYLIQCLFAFIVAPAKPSSARAPYRIYLIHKYYSRCRLFGHFEKISYTRCSNTDKHFYEFL